MKLRIGVRILLGYMLPTALMVIAGVVIYNSFLVTIETSRQVTQANEVIARANLLIRLAVDAETGERGFLLTGDESFLAPYTGAIESFAREKNILRSLLSDRPEQVSRLDEIEQFFTRWNDEIAAPAIENRRTNGLSALILKTVETGQGKGLMEEIRTRLTQVIETEEALLRIRDQANKESIRSGQLAAMLGPGIAILAALISALMISRTVSIGVGRLARASKAMASGQFDQQVKAASDDEIGDLAGAFNQMSAQLSRMMRAETEQRLSLQTISAQLNETVQTEQEQRQFLQDLIEQISKAVESLNQSSTEILAATTQQASGTSQQSDAIAQTTTTVDEVKAIAQQSSLRANEVMNTANRTLEVSRSGQEAVENTITSMQQIRTRVEGIAENILSLSEQTQQIGEIISTVNEIASQSNMLALNASVEAARAGENGKGFAVVAMEVRSLAEQSRQATTQIKNILGEIQKATNATVMATEEGTKGVERGVELAARARDSIQTLSRVIQEASQAALQMAAGGQQQVTGIEQLASAMQNINQATTQNLSSTRQTEQSAQNLADLSRRLNELVQQYQHNN